VPRTARDVVFVDGVAENLHDRFPHISKARADAYALGSQRKVAEAYVAWKIQPDLVPMAIRSAAKGYGLATVDEPPRPDTTAEGLAGLKTPFRPHGHVTAGNSAGLNDGAAGCILPPRTSPPSWACPPGCGSSTFPSPA
jgi:acetyl-CoA acyltransferase